MERNPEEIMEVECSTCLESFTSKCDISTTPCGHVFHTECMRKWLINEKSCPQCRKPCTEKQMIKIYFSGSDERRRKLEKERAEKDKVNQAMHKWLFDNNPKKKNGYSLLHWAAVNGHTKICKQILDKAYDKNPECDSDFLKCTPLHYAAEKGHTEIAKMILDKIENKNPKNINGVTPLHYAAKCGQLQIYQMITEVIDDTNPQDIKGFTPLHYAALHGHSEICEQILDNANERRTECACDVLGIQCTPHHYAAKKGHTEIAKIKEKNPKSIDGLTPLHCAATNGHSEICSMIMDKIEEKNPKDVKGNTPLHEAANCGHLETLKVIIDKVEEKNPKNNMGCTPLHIAAIKGRVEIFKVIVNNVEDLSPKMNDGKTTPLHYAIKYGQEEIHKMIISYLKIRELVSTKFKNGLHKRARMSFSSNSTNLG